MILIHFHRLTPQYRIHAASLTLPGLHISHNLEIEPHRQFTVLEPLCSFSRSLQDSTAWHFSIILWILSHCCSTNIQLHSFLKPVWFLYLYRSKLVGKASLQSITIEVSNPIPSWNVIVHPWQPQNRTKFISGVSHSDQSFSIKESSHINSSSKSKSACQEEYPSLTVSALKAITQTHHGTADVMVNVSSDTTKNDSQRT